jgi:hypothetical protein
MKSSCLNIIHQAPTILHIYFCSRTLHYLNTPLIQHKFPTQRKQDLPKRTEDMSTPDGDANLEIKDISTQSAEESELILVFTRNLRESQDQAWGLRNGLSITAGPLNNTSNYPSSSQGLEDIMQQELISEQELLARDEDPLRLGLDAVDNPAQVLDVDDTDDSYFIIPSMDTPMSGELDDDTARPTQTTERTAGAEDDPSRSGSSNTATRSEVDSGATKEDYLGYFTQVRRTAMIRQMQEDIGRYDAKREKEFGLGARDPKALKQLRIPKRDRPESAPGSAFIRNLRRRRNAIIPAGPVIGRSRLRDPGR